MDQPASIAIDKKYPLQSPIPKIVVESQIEFFIGWAWKSGTSKRMTDDTIRFETTVIQDAQLFKEDLYLQYRKSQYFDVDNLLSILRVYEI